MKMTKMIMLLITGIVMGLHLCAQNTKSENIKTEADLYWNTMPKKSVEDGFSKFVEIGPKALAKKTSIYNKDKLFESNQYQLNGLIYNELFNRLFREWGIEFWKRFPDDPRRFLWLSKSLRFEPAYFSDIRKGALSQLEDHFVVSLDTTAKNEWTNLYLKYLSEFMVSQATEANSARRFLLQSQIDQVGLFNKRWRNSEKDKFDFVKYVRDVVVFAKQFGAQGISGNLRIIYRDKKYFGLNDKEIMEYISLLKATEFAEIQEAAIKLENLQKLQKIPFQLEVVSTAGKVIDLKQYKGKLVLIDFWTISCSGCIEKMPEIKNVYDRYKNDGFEVISACLFYNNAHSKNERDRILNVHQKVGADWPLVLLGGNKGEQGKLLFEKYGWSGVPQLLLLDEEGKLIYFNSELKAKEGLERLVKQHFESKSKHEN